LLPEERIEIRTGVVVTLVAGVNALVLAVSLQGGLGVRALSGATVSAQWFIDIGLDRERLLLRRLDSISIGSSPAETTNVLGPPNTDQAVRDKQGSFLSRRLKYYSRKAYKDLANEKLDRWVALDFDASDRLINKLVSMRSADDPR
jgi:hypothetical protein